MRKYLTGFKISGCGLVSSVDAPELAESRHTVVDLLQCNDGVLRQALLRVLVEQEGLGRDGALLGRRRHRMMLRWIHDTGSGDNGGEDRQLTSQSWQERARRVGWEEQVGAQSQTQASRRRCTARAIGLR